ncbi:MAG: hypothetical protein E6J65_26055 [Deltaproteobacteria bacterium]|nr:MAG: hypothetical protein E6J65_26055 [Deltaproteobacteria bacterium]
MNRALLLLSLLAIACTSNATTVAAGQFTAPTGLAATGAGDRDVLFIADTGRDGLRALQLCNGPLLLDGGIDPADTCPSGEDRQFVPAPIRVFPASIETGDRPMRIAGVRLSRADGGSAGVALVTGSQTPPDAGSAGSSLAIVDARSLIETQSSGGVPRPVQYLDLSGTAADGGTLESPVVDVVAANPVDPDLDIEVSADAGQPVTAFAATRSELVVLDVALDGSGFAQVPSIRGRCTLDPVVPTKLAVVPGDDGQVYVADGAGDGVVSVQTSSVAGGPCTMDRISAGGRQVRSVALSPRWYDQDASGQPRTRPAGELLMMVVEPLATAQAGQTLDPGGVLFAGTGRGLVLKGIVPIPPFDPTKDVAEPMQPLSLPGNGLTREGTFLRAIKPRSQPTPPDLTLCTAAPCTPLCAVVNCPPPIQLFGLLAAVSATDGNTYVIEVPLRRFVTSSRYTVANDQGLVPTVLQVPTYSNPVTNPPVLTLDTTTFEPGVTHNASWRAVWHSQIPALERRAGTVTQPAVDTLRFTTAPANLDTWRNDPAIALAAGDVVSFAAFSLAANTSPSCQDMVTSETQRPLRFELTITDVQPDHLDLQISSIVYTPGSAADFHPEACGGEFGAVVEVRTAGTQPWLVFEGNTARGRVAEQGKFIAHQRRFDYPRSAYDPGDPSSVPPRLPQAASANDIAFSFQLSGSTPTIPSSFIWIIGSGYAPLQYSDILATAGLATAVYAYSSRRLPSRVFTSLTGSNELLEADPTILLSLSAIGVLAYR